MKKLLLIAITLGSLNGFAKDAYVNLVKGETELICKNSVLELRKEIVSSTINTLRNNIFTFDFSIYVIESPFSVSAPSMLEENGKKLFCVTVTKL